MYDFYGNPPKTKQDIYDYLTSWLQPEKSNIMVKNEIFIQELGFRRAFYNHCVFRSESTNKYVWWVFEEPDISTFPTKRFSSYEALLEYVVNDYYTRWKLDE
jgi:hypothetical protein